MAQPHVIGQTRAKPETGEQREPAQAVLLIGTQCGLECRAGVDGGQGFRRTQAAQGVRQPCARADFRPVGVRCGFFQRGTSQQAHGIGQRQAFIRGGFDGIKAIQQTAQPFAIHFDPATTDPLQPVAPGQQGPDFFGGERISVEGDGHVEIEQGIQTQRRRYVRADRGIHLGARRTTGLPLRGHPDDDACDFDLRQVVEELHGIAHVPAQGVINLAGIHHGGNPRAGFGGALHGHQQRE